MIGIFLIVMACVGTWVKRMPLNGSIFYLTFGVLIGPQALGLLTLNFLSHTLLIETLMGVAVILSLFTAGLKLRLAFDDALWKICLRLATISMVLTIFFIALVAHLFLDMGWGTAIIIGAILAPTDPVLASDVQIAKPGDQDKLRFALTGEGGFNDGVAMPFMLLGLGLLPYQQQSSAPFLWKWISINVVWASICGLSLGYIWGYLVGRFVLFLRRKYQKALGLEDFLALGLMALAYGSTEFIHANGFLAVFASGLALRRIEFQEIGKTILLERHLIGHKEVIATDSFKASAFLTHELLSFNEQVEHIMEVAVVIIIGSLISRDYFSVSSLIMASALFFLIRPLAVTLGMVGIRSMNYRQHLLMSWFGIRGLGAIYYLAFAVNRTPDHTLTSQVIQITLAVVIYSILLHGISVTPLMEAYDLKEKRGEILRAVFSLRPRSKSR